MLSSSPPLRLGPLLNHVSSLKFDLSCTICVFVHGTSRCCKSEMFIQWTGACVLFGLCYSPVVSPFRALIVVPLSCKHDFFSSERWKKIINRRFFGFFFLAETGFCVGVGVGRPRPALRGIVFGETNAQVFAKPAGLPVLYANRPLANSVVQKHNLWFIVSLD